MASKFYLSRKEKKDKYKLNHIINFKDIDSTKYNSYLRLLRFNYLTVT